MDHNACVGLYYYMGMLMDVELRAGELSAGLKGVPEGYEIGLQPLGGDQYRTRGGPADGLPVAFEAGPGGKARAIVAGDIRFERVSPEQAARLPVIGRHPAPVVDYTPEKTAAFAALFDQALAGSGDWLDYNLPYPKHEFIQYVTAQGQVIFHGSKNMHIETFVPLRKSAELYDRQGRGNRLAVYGTHEGLWAMFFGVVDRENLRGSIRNGVAYFYNRQGERLALYNFSVNQEQLAEGPWSPGALYLLPRQTFERLEIMPGVYSNEWISEESLRPLVKLALRPEDWPFLELVEGHDDSQLLRYGELSRQITDLTTRATLAGDTLTTWFPAAALPEGDLAEYLATLAILMPAIQASHAPEGDEVRLVRANLPPAVRAQVAESYARVLGGA